MIRNTISFQGDTLSASAEIAELHDLIGGLRRCVTSLKSRYGDDPAMRRIVIDADRILTDIELLDTDVSELDLDRAAAQYSGEKIAIPDTDYDRDFWRDVDDEGVGGHSRY
ncbi:hypothetical protein I545_6488 [Mycobacterium kansasii 662]|uniref:Uncharacterized protein n=3 Tax=Mycobacterium kansasii TaxID=1768 RepID=A0A1V3WSY4_MYCKA|nr:hypothetical protein MKAN_16820 [Mycobacterium kansasii ATCC 12478]EUA03173.1 hypothetical protein I547_2171 [Mycobacterium kansasii 824]EUA06269.1 hypothetical protein I545_6488 [Mycobacterium kansasii 662]KEP44500.1 hypothetical protein MKSMC1_03690 [Mycobacterium kansasii]OOK69235.1 hypothetical protein BZL30_6908 [Mycobacterium kansasii]